MLKTELRKNGSKRVHTINKEKSMTDQSYKDQTDAKSVVKTYLKTGLDRDWETS